MESQNFLIRALHKGVQAPFQIEGKTRKPTALSKTVTHATHPGSPWPPDQAPWTTGTQQDVCHCPVEIRWLLGTPRWSGSLTSCDKTPDLGGELIRCWFIQNSEWPNPWHVVSTLHTHPIFPVNIFPNQTVARSPRNPTCSEPNLVWVKVHSSRYCHLTSVVGWIVAPERQVHGLTLRTCK